MRGWCGVLLVGFLIRRRDRVRRHRGIEVPRHRAEERQREEKEEEEKSFPQITQIRADYLRGERQRVRVRGRGRGRKELSTDYADWSRLFKRIF